MEKYTPVQLAHYIAHPENGEDKKLSPIIFLHGMTAFKEMWGKIPQVIANETNRKTYVIDQRNHGDTEWTEIFNFDILVDDLVHFMDSKSIKKAIIVGHSMGGIVGINTALRRPDKVEALIVEDMIVRRLPEPMNKMLLGFITIALQNIRQVPKELNEEQATVLFMKELSNILPESMRGERKPENMNIFRGYLKRDKDGSWTFRSNFEAIKTALENRDTLMSEPEGVFNGPTSFIYGTKSVFPVKSDEDHIKKHFPNAEFIPIEGASHNITADCPEELTEAFLTFLSKL